MGIVKLNKVPQSALIYFALVSIGLAQPLYNVVYLFRKEFQMELSDVLLIIAVFQFGISAILIGTRRLFHRFGNILDYFVYAAAMISILRQVQQTYISTGSLSWGIKVGLAVSIVALAIVSVTYFRRYFDMVCGTIGWLAPAFSVFFIYQMTSHSLPLTAVADARVPTSNGPPVILVVFDELSLPMILGQDNDIDKARYPNFFKLSRMGVWYREAITNHSTTMSSFPSFLASQYKPGNAKDIWENVDSLPAKSLTKSFYDAGYGVYFYSDYFGCSSQKIRCTRHLSGSNSTFIWNVFIKFIQEFGPDFIIERYVPWVYAASVWSQHNYLETIGSNAKAGTFSIVHLLSSHAPYVFNADGGHHFLHGLGLPKDTVFDVQGADFEQITKNYSEQLRFVDFQLGRFLDFTERSGVMDDAVIMITSDHGACWEIKCPGRFEPPKIQVIRPGLVKIPAFLLSPNLPPRIDDGDFQLVDLMPTLLDATGLEIPKNLDGQSVLKSTPTGRQRLFYRQLSEEPYSIDLPPKTILVNER